ncbi:MAG: lytic transglycosylase domain-containing protein [Syntrophorhabdaceae bacterium]|nr:lytic transglycosylase domain-containing protein [Syntrophorhabdaceae bacterium]
MKIDKHRLFITGVCIILFLISALFFIDEDTFSSWRKSAKREKVVKRIAAYMEREEATIERKDLEEVAKTIYETSKAHNIDYRLVLAVIKVESNFKHTAVSSKGARGLLQIKPFHAKYIARSLGIEWFGPKTLDVPETNLKIGIAFLSELFKEFENIDLVLSAYNIGSTRLKEIISQKKRPKEVFYRNVLLEYGKNRSILPDP